jgi:hypothetical protein
LQQVIEQGLVPAGTYTLSWTGTATGRVYNSGGTPPSYAASPVTFTADGAANVVIEFTASGSTKTLSKVQFNAGTGTTWGLATPTLQTELAACQRYFYRGVNGADSTNEQVATCQAFSTVQTIGVFRFPVTMRGNPSATVSNATHFVSYNSALTAITLTGFAIDTFSPRACRLITTVSSGLVAGDASQLIANSASATLDFSAEL